MKKAYSKPEIVFEGFALSTNIAGDCEVKTHTPSYGNCAYDMGGYMVFTTDVTACAGMPIEDSESNGFCYHVPNPSSSIFNS